MAITIQDVARRAGVSPSTVSRVINKNHDISAETVAVVESAISHLGYRRSDTRRGRRPTRRLDGGRGAAQAAVALLIPDPRIGAMQTPLTGSLVHGAEGVARAHGANFLLTRLGDGGGLPPCLHPVQVDGLLVRSGSYGVNAILPNLPTVWIFRPTILPAHGDLVQPDNERIGEMASHYLAERGHRATAVFLGVPNHPDGRVRLETFVRVSTEVSASELAAGDVPAPAVLEGEPGDIIPSSRAAAPDLGNIADRLLAMTPRPTGFFLPLGDSFVEGLYRALQSRGQEYGRDFEIISCNNDTVSLQVLDSRLPNIDIQAAEVGKVAAETLFWRLQHPQDHRRLTLIEPRLVNGADSVINAPAATTGNLRSDPARTASHAFQTS